MATSPYSYPGSPSSAATGASAPVYQIDFTAVASGKRIASTKRRIRWRFGFANPEALANGLTGTDCRGEEHDVTIVWSLTSGKKLVLMDGKEIHFQTGRNNVFDFSWTMRGNHVLKVLAHANPPLSATPGFRQYDFFIDGQSFFSFPKVFRLGLAADDPRAAVSPRSPPSMAAGGYSGGGGGGGRSVRSAGSDGLAAIEAPHNPDEEEAYLREAIRNSLQETRAPAPAAASSAASVGATPAAAGGADLLLDFGAPPAAAPSDQSFASAPPQNNPYGAAPAPGAYPALMPAAPAPAATPSSTNGYAPADPFGGPPAAAPATNGYPPNNTYGAPSGYPAPAPANANALVPAAANPPQGYPQQANNNYGQAPAPPQQPQQSYPGYGQAPYGQQPPAPAPAAYGQPPAPAPAPQQGFQSPPKAVPGAVDQGYTPGTTTSSLGFASPNAYTVDGSAGHGFDGSTAGGSTAAPAPEPAPSANPALQSMNVLSGQPQSLVDGISKSGTSSGGSMADQAYARLVNMDAFDLVSEKGQERSNPFDMATAANNKKNQTSLADLKAQSGSAAPKKEIMKSSNTSMVVSNNQQSYASQYGLGQQQQQQPPMMGGGYGMMGQQQQQNGYGQQPPPAMGGYGGYGMGQQQQQQQQQQPPPMMGQQAPSMMNGYGQMPPQQQQQQPQYGQPPPLQNTYGQQPFGGY